MSLLLLNRDPENSATVRIDGVKTQTSLDEIQFSHAQYVWDKTLGQPVKDDPPVRSETNVSHTVELPPYSITVLREK